MYYKQISDICQCFKWGGMLFCILSKVPEILLVSLLALSHIGSFIVDEIIHVPCLLYHLWTARYDYAW
jgi:hypothetical protein